MNSPLGYRNFVKKHNLKLLENGADFTLTSTGDLELDHKRRIQIGDKTFNGLSHFVDNWIGNAPIIKMLFDIVKSSSENKEVLADKMSRVMQELAAGSNNPTKTFLR